MASVADALQFISYYHPPDDIAALHDAYCREESPAARDAIAQILTNSRLRRDHAAVFEPASGASGRGGSTTVHLAEADTETVGEAMTPAWQNAVEKGAARKKKAPRKRAPNKPRR